MGDLVRHQRDLVPASHSVGGVNHNFLDEGLAEKLKNRAPYLVRIPAVIDPPHSVLPGDQAGFG